MTSHGRIDGRGDADETAMTTPPPHPVFHAGDVHLQSGQILRDARLAYQTHGRLNAAGDNAILFPVWFAGHHDDNGWLIGPGRVLDPDRYFIIVPDLLGNGVSSSPSNTPAPQDGPRFPQVTVLDNVRLQHRLVTEVLGVERLRLVLGASMGAMQTFHWAALYPSMVERIAPMCGAARCSRHNQVFIEGLRAALTADSAWNDGDYAEPPRRGLRAMARVYAGWGFSQAFFREELDRTRLGYATLEDYISGFWEQALGACDANDLLAMLWTWQHGDIAANDTFDGDFDAALAAIRARAVVMPGQTDLYFPPQDSEREVARMRDAQLQVIPSLWGHHASGIDLNPEDVAFIEDRLRALLAD